MGDCQWFEVKRKHRTQCSLPAAPGEDYCLFHLVLVIRIEVRKMALELLFEKYKKEFGKKGEG